MRLTICFLLGALAASIGVNVHLAGESAPECNLVTSARIDLTPEQKDRILCCGG